MAQKNMILALVLSFLITALGLIYAGDVKKGLILLVISIIFNVLYFTVHPMLGVVAAIIWIYSMYATYQEVKAVNGE